eukprot:748319-Hanusia_phi.AAC.1
MYPCPSLTLHLEAVTPPPERRRRPGPSPIRSEGRAPRGPRPGRHCSGSRALAVVRVLRGRRRRIGPDENHLQENKTESNHTSSSPSHTSICV